MSARRITLLNLPEDKVAIHCCPMDHEARHRYIFLELPHFLKVLLCL